MTALATARVERTDDGVVIVRVRGDVDQRPEDAEANIAAAREAGGRLCPVLVDLRVARPLSAEVRHLYSGRPLTDAFTALALLVPVGAFGRMFGNVYLRVARPGVPAQLFADEAAALAWLRSR
jgi:hypothetical protein